MVATRILERCHCFRRSVYRHARFGTDAKSIEVAVRRVRIPPFITRSIWKV